MSLFIRELQELVSAPFSEFKSTFKNIRSAERNFQLIVELASDINTQIVADNGVQTPDTYRESFNKMVELNILDKKSLQAFVKSSNLRNILTHEYDFDQDNFIFYTSTKSFIPLYEEYIRSVQKYLINGKI